LKVTFEKERQWLAGQPGGVCVFSESGPVGIGLIDAVVQAIEFQDRRIAELEARMGMRAGTVGT
jgi:hypothetical protein